MRPPAWRFARFRAIALCLALAPSVARADQANIAVAANFAAPAKRIADDFAQRSGHRLVVSSGSTGKFYAQIKNGAPFDVLLAADSATPQRLEREQLAVKDSRFAYAVGKLVLWSPDTRLVDAEGDVLRKGTFRRLAMANPKLAPYGAAAQQAMEKLGVWGALQAKLVQGENIAQTFQFIASGNAALGFVALSQIHEAGKQVGGSTWIVPPGLHAPLRQEAVLLVRGGSNAAARSFLDFLRSAPAQQLIRTYGYDAP